MTPTSTYRLQMHADFTLRHALEILPYLDSLGISHVYTSSLLVAKPGSRHGYDVIDHSRLNPEIGTPEDLLAFSKELKARNMGLILDVVPNHMSVGGANRWWLDVLEHGPSSPYANYFDIAWDDHYRESLRGKVLLPILGVTYGEALESGQIVPKYEDGTFFLQFYESRLPIDPRTYSLVLRPVLDELKAADPAGPGVLELQSILGSIRHLPPRSEADPTRLAEGRDEIAVVKRRLLAWGGENANASAVAGRLAKLTADPEGLDHLIEAQAYRPCFWRVASDEINYRRFFDVNDLAALTTEREEVFEDVHRLVFEWLEAGVVDGLRIDHPDGLYDPQQYLDRLQAKWRATDPARPPLYIAVEKILGTGEELPKSWACAGTTGYEFLNVVNSLFVNPTAARSITLAHRQLIGADPFGGADAAFEELVYQKKFLILQSSLTSELHVLSGHFDRLAQADRTSRDFTLNGIRHALREVLSCFPIYRTYVDGEVHEADPPAILRAVVQARRRNPLLGRAIFDFIRDTLLLKDPASGPASPEYRAAQVRCAGKFQQLSAPVMAKGFEDTSLYIFNRLTSLNEVGGDPKVFGRKPADVHAFYQGRGSGDLSPLSTHDTKRGEDVRARINVLADLPDEWAACLTRWAGSNDRHRPDPQADVIPDRNEEYLLYQTLVGTWDGGPSDEYRGRIKDYLTKAIQEAKVHSTWINPDAEYLKAVGEFIDAVLDPRRSAEFLADLAAFADRIRPAAVVNSLAQTLLRCTLPGVPDTYQGTEAVEFHLVDPDNRRPVDYARRREWLTSLDAGPVAGNDPRAKMLVLAKALRLRRRMPEVFEKGEYLPLAVEGPEADRVFAFLRTHGGKACLVAVPRFTADRGDWGDTRIVLPDGWRGRVWASEFGGSVGDRDGAIPAAKLFAAFPVTLAVV